MATTVGRLTGLEEADGFKVGAIVGVEVDLMVGEMVDKAVGAVGAVLGANTQLVS